MVIVLVFACVLSVCVCGLASYLAHKGWRGMSSARLESWWPRTRTSLGQSPRCSRSAALLQSKGKGVCVAVGVAMRGEGQGAGQRRMFI